MARIQLEGLESHVSRIRNCERWTGIVVKDAEIRKRARPNKKRRMVLKEKALMKVRGREQIEKLRTEKEEAEREKRTRRNREKKVKKKAMEKAKKVEAGMLGVFMIVEFWLQ